MEKRVKKKFFYFLHPSGLIMGKFWGKVKLGNVVCMFDQLIILCTVFLFVQTKYFFVQVSIEFIYLAKFA